METTSPEIRSAAPRVYHIEDRRAGDSRPGDGEASLGTFAMMSSALLQKVYHFLIKVEVFIYTTPIETLLAPFPIRDSRLDFLGPTSWSDPYPEHLGPHQRCFN